MDKNYYLLFFTLFWTSICQGQLLLHNFTIAGILFNAVIFGFVTLKFVMIKSGSFADLYFEKVQSELALFKVG